MQKVSITIDGVSHGSKAWDRGTGGPDAFSEGDNGGRRLRIDRRWFSYTAHIPERRCGHDRRIGMERRCCQERRTSSGKRRRAGVERRNGDERRAAAIDL